MPSTLEVAKVSKNGQITIPVDIRRALNLHPGDKVLFSRSNDGAIVIGNASVSAIKLAQEAFSGAAPDFGFADETDVLDAVMQGRYGDATQ
jgi:AbrB family looped-hinge helix DNA binding protein